jgi:uncharacterized protein with PQ loop repeat
MNVIDMAGWLGSALFAVCGLPQAVHSYKVKNSHGLTWGFLALWLGGEIFTLIYILPKEGVAPLILNYTLNLVFLAIIAWYKIFPQNQAGRPAPSLGDTRAAKPSELH